MQNKPPLSHRYDDIIELPHPVSACRTHLSGTERAAQFAPFAALTGHNAAIRETARQTDSRMELTEDRKAVLDRTLRYLLEHHVERPEVTITHFVPDNKKSGGAYIRTTGQIVKFKVAQNLIIMNNQTTIPISTIYDIQFISKRPPPNFTDYDSW